MIKQTNNYKCDVCDEEWKEVDLMLPGNTTLTDAFVKKHMNCTPRFKEFSIKDSHKPDDDIHVYERLGLLLIKQRHSSVLASPKEILELMDKLEAQRSILEAM